MKVRLPRVESDEKGFRLIQDDQLLHEVSWADVLEISAFKRDLVIVDLICLGFRIDESDRFIEVSEEVPGYGSFIETLERHFSLERGWWSEVACPAFKTNWATIWKKPA